VTIHAFVDESQRGPYVVCAVLVAPKELAAMRTALRAMLMPGQRRLHFTQERVQRRRGLLSEMAELPFRARIYQSKAKEPLARTLAMDALLQDLANLEGRRLVMERREHSQDRRERQQIVKAINTGGAPAGLVYDHLPPHEEPLLWIADAIAWAHGARGEWRPRINSMIENVHDLDAYS